MNVHESFIHHSKKQKKNQKTGNNTISLDKRMDLKKCSPITDSLCYKAETNTPL